MRMLLTVGCVMAMLTLPAISSSAAAASAIAFGQRTIHTASAPTIDEAVQKSLEACSRKESHCKILTKCSERGHGAVSASQFNGYIESIGAACARPTNEDARQLSDQHCRPQASRGECALRAQWID